MLIRLTILDRGLRQSTIFITMSAESTVDILSHVHGRDTLGNYEI